MLPRNNADVTHCEIKENYEEGVDIYNFLKAFVVHVAREVNKTWNNRLFIQLAYKF